MYGSSRRTNFVFIIIFCEKKFIMKALQNFEEKKHINIGQILKYRKNLVQLDINHFSIDSESLCTSSDAIYYCLLLQWIYNFQMERTCALVIFPPLFVSKNKFIE